MRLPEERDGIRAPADLAERRELMAQALSAGAWRTSPAPREERLNGVRVLRFSPAGAARSRVLHIHGGAFRLGCPEMVGAYAATLAAHCEVEVVCPAYRLAPEHPFPAGLTDVLRVAQALAEESAGSVVICGDSAGGGLAASLTSLCVASGLGVAALVLLSPWLDLTVTSPAFDRNAASDPLFSRSSAATAADLYLQGHSARDPLASPLFGALAGFPPTLVSIGEGEVLADDGRRFVEALWAAGVAARLSAIPRMEHVAVTRDRALEGAKTTFETITSFLDEILRTEA